MMGPGIFENVKLLFNKNPEDFMLENGDSIDSSLRRYIVRGYRVYRVKGC